MTGTIARGLARLKTIKSQIEKITSDIDQYSAANDHKKHLLGDNKATIKDTQNQAQEQINAWYQQFNDLITEYMSIKKSIDRTNMETIINVGGVEMSIYEALCQKREIADMKAKFVRAFGNSVKRAQMDVDKYNAQFAAAAEEIKKMNLADIVYFLDRKKIEEIEQYLNKFIVEVDGELNSINAITMMV